MAAILIVDDEPLNRELLRAYLDGAGHRLIEVGSGEEALAALERDRPDLVLLDVMLPGIDGFTTAERIKAHTRDELVPVVLVTALSDLSARVRGLRAGADEFLTKPVDRSELLLRVSNLLSLRDKEMALARRNVELVELQRFRDEMAAMIVHDLKSPLSVILTNLDYVLEGGDPTETREALLDSRSAGNRALRLIGNLLDLSRLEAGQLRLERTRTRLDALVTPLLRQRAHLAQAREIALECRVEPRLEVNADVELLSRVVENVFDNAFRHTPPGGRIAVQADTAPSAVRLRIGNSGEPIPPEARERIFERFAQERGDVGRMNLGLGLYFCRLAAEAHGGRIWVEQTRELPTVFGLELPA